MKQREDSNSDFFKKWTFLGSNDNETWIKLDKRSDVEGFYSTGAERLFECKKGSYKYFKIMSDIIGLITIKRIDIYGIHCNKGEDCNIRKLFNRSCSKKAKTQRIFVFVILCFSKY